MVGAPIGKRKAPPQGGRRKKRFTGRTSVTESDDSDYVLPPADESGSEGLTGSSSDISDTESHSSMLELSDTALSLTTQAGSMPDSDFDTDEEEKENTACPTTVTKKRRSGRISMAGIYRC